jgi:hypothetical protein
MRVASRSDPPRRRNVKALRNSIVLAAAALAFSAHAASAAYLGAIEYERFTNSLEPFHVDLGGAKATLPDATITHNDFNGAATLPGGLPVDYTVHIDRTYLGDGKSNTADDVADWYWFKLDPTAMNGASSAMADASLTIVAGADAYISGVRFYLYETNPDGTPTGSPYGQINNGGQIVLSGFVPGEIYVMKVTGNLRMDTDPNGDNSTNVGRYDIVLGLQGVSAIPVPPALVLLLTGLGALFGFGRARRATA